MLVNINNKEFFNKQLKLGMFVPCDEDNNVYDARGIDEKRLTGTFYTQGKERVIFNGFVLSDIKEEVTILKNKLTQIYVLPNNTFIVECLITNIKIKVNTIIDFLYHTRDFYL